MPRSIFKNSVIAIAGPLPGSLTADNIERWTSLRRGRFTNDFDETVTHLLFRDALKRGKRFHIVHSDWFEFSVVQEKKLPENEYSMKRMLAKQNATEREKARLERGRRHGDKFVNTNLYHTYVDRAHFSYQVDLYRHDEATGDTERYTLSLWESNAKPHLYWFTAKYLRRKGDSQPSYHRESRWPGKWREEMGRFMRFFQIKTKLEWEDRVLGEKTMPAAFQRVGSRWDVD
ncbi:hypothetical protein RJ55_04140 [Drechmeria coniospora]|nr:hypothetical protein RJ55_04140 [Drechmeria coniospora]